MPPHPTLYIKRNIINSFGGFDTKLKISADYMFILKNVFSTKFLILNIFQGIY